MTLTLSQLRQFLPAVPMRAAGDFLLQGMSIDTRTLVPGNLYVALTGQQVDGHQYVEEAAKRGASAALVNHWVEGVELPQIQFDDCEIGMGVLAKLWREQCDPTLIAVTGSNGKTTVKQMLGAIFSSHFPGEQTLITEGNFNNHQGLPLTLARLSLETKMAIIEHGANHHGEIAYLAGLSQPDIAVITNAGPAHLEGFGDIAGVAKAKGELIDGLSKNGTAILNADDDFFLDWLARAEPRSVLSFGCHDHADVQIRSWAAEQFELDYAGDRITLINHLPGKHNAMNVAAATAVAIAAGLPFSSSAQAAIGYTPVKGRFAEVPDYSAAHLINDTYNANPSSVIAGIYSLPAGQPRWLVLGEMRELGESSEYWHRKVGDVAREAGIDRLFCYGRAMQAAVEAFGGKAQCYATHATIVAAIQQALSLENNKPWILVKGSLTTNMRAVIDGLRGSAC